jgi:anti-anti-sigma factor
LTVGVSESEATLYVRLGGDFDLAGVGPVERAFDRLSQTPLPTRVVLDLRNVTFLDLAGLRTILRANERARAEGLDVAVVRPLGLANRVFTLTRAGNGLQMVDEPSAA